MPFIVIKNMDNRAERKLLDMVDADNFKSACKLIRTNMCRGDEGRSSYKMTVTFKKIDMTTMPNYDDANRFGFYLDETIDHMDFDTNEDLMWYLINSSTRGSWIYFNVNKSFKPIR
jgi:hypothetical protein